MLGALLLVGEQLAGERGVFLGRLPRGRVPAMGRTVISPSSTRTITSGEEPTRWTSGARR